MFKTDSFLSNKKLSFNQNVWRDHATMQQDVLLHFWVIFLHLNQAEIWKKNILLSSSRAFSLSTPTFSLSTPVENSEATCKKATKCNKHFGGMGSPLASLFPPALLKESEFTFSLGLNVATTECCCLWQWCCCLFSASPGQTATNPLQPPNSSYPGRNPVPCHRLQPTTCSVLF